MRTINKKNTKSFTIKMWFHRIWIAFCFLCLICFSGFCIWAWKSGVIQDTSEEIIEEFHNITGNMGFRLDDIFIDGRIRTEKTEIRTALDLPVDNLMTKLNIEQMQKNLTELPWVKEASVSRQLPNILYIRLTEKKPIALWQKGKQHYPIDEDGNIIDTKCEDCINLPIIVGDKAYLYAPKLIKTLETFAIIQHIFPEPISKAVTYPFLIRVSDIIYRLLCQAE